jgi:hypothetical protein
VARRGQILAAFDSVPPSVGADNPATASASTLALIRDTCSRVRSRRSAIPPGDPIRAEEYHPRPPQKPGSLLRSSNDVLQPAALP